LKEAERKYEYWDSEGLKRRKRRGYDEEEEAYPKEKKTRP
jgi:hypothetical protein